jgi:hypothetical protein
MVEDVNFPNRIPPVSAAGRVKKVNRKKREQEKPPFEKYLDAEDEKKKRKKKRKNESQSAEPSDKDPKGSTNDSVEPSNSSGPVEAEEDTEKKIIDIRI